MFGLKWLWKSNIDKSNFVSKEFFSTTLQDYVNRDLFNTTLQSYITSTTLNNTLTNYVSTNTTQTITNLKTFRAAPIGLELKQADNRSDKQYIVYRRNDNTTTFSLGSELTETSLEVNRGNLKIQTLENNKSVIFQTPSVIFNNSIPQFGTEIKAGYGGVTVKFLPEDNSTKTLQFYNSTNTDTRRFNLKVSEPTEASNPATKNYVDNQISNIQIPTNAVTTNTNQTISGEKTFSSLVTITKTNGALAFKPGTNQPAYFEFYNGNTRIGYFGKGSSGNNNMVLGAQSGKISLEASQGVEIPEPTAANNPTTKTYVDSQVNTLQQSINNLIQKRDYVFNSQSSTPELYGETYQYTLAISDLQETMVLGVNINFKNQSNAATKATYWNVSWVTTWGPKIYIKIWIDKFIYNGLAADVRNLDFSNLSVRVFYAPNHSAREVDKVYQGEVVTLPEIKGGK